MDTGKQRTEFQNNLSHYQHAFLWQISTKSIIVNTEGIQISICGVPHPSFRWLSDIPNRPKKTKNRIGNCLQQISCIYFMKLVITLKKEKYRVGKLGKQ